MREGFSPLVSIIIPTYNRESLLGETLNSVLAQTYQNWECVIVDDGSTDGTVNVISEFCKKDKRLKYFQRDKEPKGACICRNIGFEKSKGEYIIFLDSDDLLGKDSLRQRIEKIINRSLSLDFYVFPVKLFFDFVDDCEFYINKSFPNNTILFEFLNQNMPWVICSVLWRRDTLYRLGGFDESLLSWQDWDLHVRALLGNYTFEIFEPGTVVPIYYRQNVENSISRTGSARPKILNRIDLFEKVYYYLNTSGALSKAIRRSIAKLILVNAMKADKFESVLYRKIISLNLLSRPQYFFWTFYSWCHFKKLYIVKRMLDFVAYKFIGYHILDFHARTYKKYFPV